MLLGEAATAHPDGTISILRAWINQFLVQGPPFPFRGAIIVRIEAEIGDSGSHRFDLRCLNEDGADVLPKLEGSFEVPQGGGTIAFVLSPQVQFARAGQFLFVLRVDQVQLAEWPLRVSPVPPNPPAPPAAPA
jgi:hypothetical protein